MTDVVKNLPNILTFLRLGLIPIFVWLMAHGSKEAIFAATVIFIFAALTDYADGLIARKFHAVSDFGKLLDPVADKILVMAALVMLVAQRSDSLGEPWVPGWMVVLILAREIWVTGIRAVAATAGKVIAAGNAGKLKSFLQMVAIVLLLQHDLLLIGEKGSSGITAQLPGEALLMLSIVFSYKGAFEYTWAVLGTESNSVK